MRWLWRMSGFCRSYWLWPCLSGSHTIPGSPARFGGGRSFRTSLVSIPLLGHRLVAGIRRRLRLGLRRSQMRRREGLGCGAVAGGDVALRQGLQLILSVNAQQNVREMPPAHGADSVVKQLLVRVGYPQRGVFWLDRPESRGLVGG